MKKGHDNKKSEINSQNQPKMKITQREGSVSLKTKKPAKS